MRNSILLKKDWTEKGTESEPTYPRHAPTIAQHFCRELHPARALFSTARGYETRANGGNSPKCGLANTRRAPYLGHLAPGDTTAARALSRGILPREASEGPVKRIKPRRHEPRRRIVVQILKGLRCRHGGQPVCSSWSAPDDAPGACRRCRLTG